MKTNIIWITLFILFLNSFFLIAQEQKRSSQWWMRGKSHYIFKDDWKADFLCYGAKKSPQAIKKPFQGLWNDIGKTYFYEFKLKLSSHAEKAWLQLWSSGASELLINNKSVGLNYDPGLVETYFFAKYLKVGDNKITIRFSSFKDYWEVIAEGGVFCKDGSYIAFDTNKTWATETGIEIHKKRKLGPKGYAGSFHHAIILQVTPEQKAKAAVNNILAECNRLNSSAGSGEYKYWKSRDIKEILRISQQSPEEATWQKIIELTSLARKGAESLFPLVLSGKYQEVMTRSAKFTKLISEAKKMHIILLKTAELRDRLKALEYQLVLIEGENKIIKDRNADWQLLLRQANKAISDGKKELQAVCNQERFFPDDALAILKALQNVNNINMEIEAFTGFPLDSLNKSRQNRLGWVATEKMLNSSIFDRFCKISPGNSSLISNQRRFVGMGVVRELHYADGSEMLFLNSALTPASLLVTSTDSIQFSDWKSCNYRAPNMLTLNLDGKVANIQLEKNKILFDRDSGHNMYENWLILWNSENAEKRSEPFLLLLEKYPVKISQSTSATGRMKLQFQFQGQGARIIALPLNLEEKGFIKMTEKHLAIIRKWAAWLRNYPINFAEVCYPDGENMFVRMKYEYLSLNWDKNLQKPESIPTAPVPPLFTYARQYNWPAAKFAAAGIPVATGYRAYPVKSAQDTGEYFLISGTDIIGYKYNRKEPKRMLYGIGEFIKGLTPPEQLYKDVERWGFNSTRPQFHFNRNFEWGWKYQNTGFFFSHPDKRQCAEDACSPGGKILFGKNTQNALKAYIKNFQNRNMTCILNWFWNDKPLQNPKTWEKHPEVRNMIVEFWGKVAETLADFPPEAVVFDLFNEPYAADHESYNKLVTDVIREIRKYDKTHTICVEPGNGWADAWHMDGLKIPKDPKLMIEWHGYGVHGVHAKTGYNLYYPRYQEDRTAASYDEWEERMALGPIRASIRLDAEVLHGEFGASFIGPEGCPEAWLKDVLSLSRKYRQHWNWWNWDGRGIARTGLKSGEKENPLVPILQEFAR